MSARDGYRCLDIKISLLSLDKLADAGTFGWVRITAILKHDPNASSKDGTRGVFAAESLVYAEHEGFACQGRVAHDATHASHTALGALEILSVKSWIIREPAPLTVVAPFNLYANIVRERLFEVDVDTAKLGQCSLDICLAGDNVRL
jgi:hypothetical protein